MRVCTHVCRDGVRHPLPDQDLAVKLLEDLHEVVMPLRNEFSLKYDALGELVGTGRVQGCCRRYSRFTSGRRTKVRLIFVRLRRRETEYVEFKDMNSCVATLLHEMAHIRVPNHGELFAKLLRDLYSKAASMGIFDCNITPQLSLPCPWEKQLYFRGGCIEDAELEQMVKDAKGMWICRAGQEKAAAPEGSAAELVEDGSDDDIQDEVNKRLVNSI